MPGWALDVYYKFDVSPDAVTRLTQMSTQTNWAHLSVTKGADGKFTVDTDWTYPNLSDALTKMSALVVLSNFDGATLKATA